MSAPERWLQAAQAFWQHWRTLAVRLAPGPRVQPQQLQAEDALTRWRAVQALAHHPQPPMLSHLLALSNDPDEMVRAQVGDTLVSWGPGLVLEPLRHALSAQPAPAAAVTLLHVMARTPHPANRSAITPWLESDNPAIKAAAFMALAALGDDNDLPLLQEAFASEDLPLQRAIMAALCAPAAAPLAATALDSPDIILRQRATQAQARIQRRAQKQPPKR